MTGSETHLGGGRGEVGFVGLGTMGKPMATNLVRAGLDVLVFDLDPAPVAELVALGARSAPLNEIGERCRLVEVAVWDSAGVEQVLVGDSSGERHHRCCALRERSSPYTAPSSLATCRNVADAGTDTRRWRTRCRDEWWPGPGRRGTLTIMVGGERSDFDACSDVFEILGNDVFHVGPLGAGMTAKLCNNLMVLANLEAVREALALATAAGITAERMIELGSASTADSWALRHGFALYEQAKGTPAFDNQQGMQVKDLALAVQLARELGVPGEGAVADFFQRRAAES